MDNSLDDRWIMRWGLGNTPILDFGSGWDNIVLDLDGELMSLVPDYTVLQIKEKFGMLRMYVSLPEDIDEETKVKVYTAISRAEEKSSHVCMFCGASGETKAIRGWLRTCCDEHSRD